MRLYFVQDILGRFAPQGNLLKERWEQDIKYSRVYNAKTGASVTSTYANNHGLSTKVVYIEFDKDDLKTV